ncbi:MAG: tetratricopeptide repeat protein, partial [Planctomycetota bacterium]
AWRRHPGDPDVGALFAESLMDLRPWDLWTLEGEPRPEVPEILATLEAVLKIAPDHPQALHLTIHALEPSPHPERAFAAADRLRHRLPGIGHLVHMPSHIDVLLGRYEEAVEANRRALAADRVHVARVGRKGFFTMYRAHNYHMLVYAAMFEGRSREALAAARELVAEMPGGVVREMPDVLEAYLAVPLHVLVRFGRWEEILREPPPARDLRALAAFRLYARTLAFSSLGRLAEAEESLRDFEQAAAEVPESRAAGNNGVRALLEVAKAMLEGELEYRRGGPDRAFERLREAVKLDDALRYDEPRGWMQPPRHALGALLLERGRAEEAEAVYRRDLERHPDNGWSLHGLAECQRRLGRNEEAEKTAGRLRTAWARADVEIYGSCFCRRRA